MRVYTHLQPQMGKICLTADGADEGRGEEKKKKERKKFFPFFFILFLICVYLFDLCPICGSSSFDSLPYKTS
jgi:hypothetical protein